MPESLAFIVSTSGSWPPANGPLQNFWNDSRIMKTAPQPQKQAAQVGPVPETVVFPTITARQADGSLNVKTGKPLAWLSPAQFAMFFGVDRNTIYRWKDEGTIPRQYIKPNGKRKIGISAAAVEIVQDTLRKLRGHDPLSTEPTAKEILNTV
jgi:hypothetical protein